MVKDVAARVGISTSTWRAYVNRSQAPKPDGKYDERTPWWLASTVDAWSAARPRKSAVSE